MCRLGITIAPRGEMIMKSKMTVNCRNPRMPITTFSYREKLMRTGARVASLSMRFLYQASNDQGERRRDARSQNQGYLSQSPTFSLAPRREHRDRSDC